MRGQTNASNIGGTVGDDTHPIKIVDGVATPVSNKLVKFEQDITSSIVLTGLASGTYCVSKKNGMCTISFNTDAVVTVGSDSVIAAVPRSALPLVTAIITTTNGTPIGRCFIYRVYGPTALYATVSTGGSNLSMTLTYPIEE